jgi:hypothetical protein
VKLKVSRARAAAVSAAQASPGSQVRSPSEEEARELTSEAILVTPRCDPESSSITRAERRHAETVRASGTQLNAPSETNALSQVPPSSWRERITFDALGWHMAERIAESKLLAGDALDIAFTVGYNDHPEYGGLELLLRDLKI